MKELKELKYHSEEYDVDINRYLTYSQIQQIVNSVGQFDSWAERQQNIDMLVLYHATNIGAESIEKCTHDELLKSGLIDVVNKEVYNINEVKDALNYNESVQRALNLIARELPTYIDKIEGVLKHGRKRTKKQSTNSSVSSKSR